MKATNTVARGYKQLMVDLATHTHIKALAADWNRPMSSIIGMLIYPPVRDMLVLKEAMRRVTSPDLSAALHMLTNTVVRSRQMEIDQLVSISIIPKFSGSKYPESILMFCEDEDMEQNMKSLLRYLSI